MTLYVKNKNVILNRLDLKNKLKIEVESKHKTLPF